MNGEKQCWRCIYGVNMTGDIRCHNKCVVESKLETDPYDCVFYDEISENYIDDMEKVMENT